jgi:hypothetical protein
VIGKSSSLVDVAFAASTALDAAGIVAILCGGSAAAFYCASYQSLDADFVLRFEVRARDVDRALQAIGFHRNASNIYQHPDVEFTVEFPIGPLMIGRKFVETWTTVRRLGLRSFSSLLGVEGPIGSRRRARRSASRNGP